MGREAAVFPLIHGASCEQVLPPWAPSLSLPTAHAKKIREKALSTLHFKKPPVYGQGGDESEIKQILITKLRDNNNLDYILTQL